MGTARKRLALLLAYDGDALGGWQRNPALRTGQGVLEVALRQIGRRVRPQAASRTDAGVHAAGQMVHVDLEDEDASPEQLRAELNAALPADLRVIDAAWAPRRFHARWSSRGKVYTYLMSTPADHALAAADPFLTNRTWILPDPRAFPSREGTSADLDEAAMAAALASLLGRRDFRGLATMRDRGRGDQTVRRLGAARLQGCDWPGEAGGRLVAVTVSADAFLKHMVRNLAALLAQVGYGEIAADEVADLVAQRHRHFGPRAPGRGLTLVRVRYPVPVDPFHRRP